MKYSLVFTLIITVLLSCKKEHAKFNFDTSETDQVFNKVCDSFISKSVKDNIWIEYQGNVKDTAVYSVNQINNISIDEKLLPYKIFKTKDKWCFIAKKNEKINHNDLIIFLKKHNLYHEKVAFWPSYNKEYWYIKLYKNEFGKLTFSRIINPYYLYGNDVKYELFE